MSTRNRSFDAGAAAGDQLAAKKRALLNRLLSAEETRSSQLLIPRRPPDAGPLPLSFAQEGLWFIDQMNPGAVAYNTLLPLRLEGSLDVGALERTLEEILRRHEVLRTTFPALAGRPIQAISDEVLAPLERVTLQDPPVSDRDAEIQRALVHELERPFDLQRGPLCRAKLIRVDERTHVLLLSVHHSAFDGMSAGILAHEVQLLYGAFSSGKPSPLQDLAVQYGDFALWQRQTMQGETLRKGLDYWKQALEGSAPLQLPCDHLPGATGSSVGTRQSLALSTELSEAIRELSRLEGVTQFMTLLAAFGVLMQRYSGQDDISMGSPVTLRRQAELRNLIGLFVNMVVMRIDLSGAPSFRALLSRVRKTVLGALRHADVPFEKLVEDLQPHRDLVRNPIFQVAFALESTTEGPRSETGGLALGAMPDANRAARFDVEAIVRDQPRGLTVQLTCKADMFEAPTVGRMLAHFRSLLEAIIANPDCPISTLPMLSPDERNQVLIEWNRTRTDLPRDACVHQLFEEQAGRTPDALAAAFDGRELTYRQLNEQANQLARHLRSLGVRREALVGICMERSLNLVLGILGILKAGGAYVPLDPDYPSERLRLMLEDTGAPVLLTQEHLRARIPPYAGKILCLDSQWGDFTGESAENLASDASPEDLAYIIYTSGSTGTPKGVAVPHRAINRLVCRTDYIQLEASDRVAQASVCSFDAATFEIWGALLNGARLVGIPREVVLSPAALSAYLGEQGITVLFLTTALFNQVARDAPGAFAGLRYLLFGGQLVDPRWVRAVLANRPPEHLLHVYGPTECTTFATWYAVERLTEDDSTVPIGRPIANTRAYVLDSHLNPVPIGIPGELYLGGEGLARGYWNRPELTAERFVADPFSSEPGARLYRTGDWVRFGTDGAIEFIGRRDNQVKLRGFRIELGEIESALQTHSAVAEAAVLAREDVPGERRLVAYVILTRGHSVGLAELRDHLRQKLPDYMVPSALVVLDYLPLTPNGKVDRTALPAPVGERQLEHAYVAPRSELEQRIAALWREALRVDQVGIHDNFFDLGGHSLLVVQVHSRLKEQLGREVPVVELFQYPTIESLARHLGGETHEKPLLREAQARVSRRAGGAGGRGAIAIVGMAGRFPGANGIEAFWGYLCNGVESIRFFSEQELRDSGIDETTIKDQRYVRARGVLEGAELFDPSFFGYTPREAELIDPQQRLFLECAWEALERASHDPERFPGLIGVYAGSSLNTYLSNLHSQPELLASVGGLTALLASGQDFLPTRVSYKLNLRGPSVNVQTACSTSLVAVHEACRSLLDHQCDLALAGGASVKVPLKSGYMYVEEGIGSPDGHCRAFDARSRGTVGGDGVAVVVLKRLEEALADRDTIHAVILGTAINNDGSLKVGYTAPSVEGQAEAIALAYATAGVDPDSVSYVEAHGTGTTLGDPIEVAALNRVFGHPARPRRSCALGSVKSNVGHLDAAAGVTGLIKAALCLEHQTLVPSLHFQHPNPRIDFDSGPFYVNTELRAWEGKPGEPRRAGVSSFGLGGTNAHAVLEEAPALEPSAPPRDWQLLALSAKTELALENAASRLAAHLKQNPDLNLADVAYTLQLGRRQLEHRRVVLCRDRQGALEALEGRNPARVWSGQAPAKPPAVAFTFPGQGAQHVHMGHELYEREPVFREAVDTCCEELKPLLGLDLRQVIYPPEQDLEDATRRLRHTALTQPALFVVEYALAQLWMKWGVRPQAMIGHSIGEYVAACLAGVFGLGDALRLVAERGRLMGQLPPGAMLSVPLPEREVLSLLGEGVSLAAVNAPGLCVVAGPEPAVAELERKLRALGLEPRMLQTSHAFHSAMMEPIVGLFTQRLKNLKMAEPNTPFVSNVSGAWITPEQATDPSYWGRHLRHTVRFSQGLELLLQEPDRLLLEVGPGQTLSSLARAHRASSRGPLIAPSLPPSSGRQIDEGLPWKSLGGLWLNGVPVDWPALHSGQQRRRIVLPTYPFERQRYWIEPRQALTRQDRVRRKPDPRDWLYVPSWRRSSPPVVPPSIGASRWLLFTDGSEFGVRLASELRKVEAEVVCVSAGDQFARLPDGGYSISPGRREDYDLLVAELAARGKVPEKIVHLWCVLPAGESQRPDDSLGPALDRGFYSLVFLVQALIARGITDPLGLAVVSSHAHEVTGDEVLRPANAAALGSCKVIGLEHPHITCRSIDVALDPSSGSPASLAETLAADLRAPWIDPVTAYRGRYRWIQAFDQLPLGAPPTIPALVRPSGVYLITGGLGGVGQEMASYLARAARAKLILISRGGLPDPGQWARWLAEHPSEDSVSAKIRRVQELEAMGAEVLVCAADVADEPQMAAALARAEARFGPLRGVMHAAGAEKRGVPLRLIQRSDCEEQFRPKLQGLLVLDRLLHDRELDFLLVHSSLASVMGVTDFVAYTASHLFMDTFARQRGRNGKTRWITINWDNWGLQKADGQSLPAGLADFTMSAAEGTDVLGRVLSADRVNHVLVSTGDLKARVDQWTQRYQPQGPESPGKTHPSPLHPRPALSTKYEGPHNDIERTLVKIWQEILGIDAVGIHDNFFELGGDSVANIQITAHANQLGLKVTPKQVFEHQTIAGLAAVAGTVAEVEAEQGIITGPVPLTPIQRWFFEQDFPHPHHFNQAMLLEIRQRFGAQILDQALAQLLRHHDALRLRYSRTATGWAQRVDEPGDPVGVQRFDLAELSSAEQVRAIEARAAELQTSLDLQKGPLVRVAYFDLGAGRPGRLLVIVHHLAIDVVSWRILLEDLERAYSQLSLGHPVALPAKTSSIRSWSEQLSGYAQTDAAERELDFWRRLGGKRLEPIPVEKDDGPNTFASASEVSARLTAEETRTLLTDASRAYDTQINDILLAALWQAFNKWTGHTVLALTLEGHGREPILDGIDVSRTVGWFTTLYPVFLEPTDAPDLGELIKSMKEQLRAIPHQGIGYGLLRYLNPKATVSEALAALPVPQVSFLYLGQLDATFSGDSLLVPAQESRGLLRHPNSERLQLIEVSAMILRGCLHCTWTYSRNLHRQETIQALSHRFLEALRRLIAHCQGVKGNHLYAPSDFTAAALSQSDLEEIARRFGSPNEASSR